MYWNCIESSGVSVYKHQFALQIRLWRHFICSLAAWSSKGVNKEINSAPQTCHLQGVFVVIITLAKCPLQQRSTFPHDTAYTNYKPLKPHIIRKRDIFLCRATRLLTVLNIASSVLVYVHIPSCVDLTLKRKSNGMQKICHTATRDSQSFLPLTVLCKHRC
jgi:hypothetical protein